MIARLREVSAAALLGVLVAAPALGQAERSWVDPPASAVAWGPDWMPITPKRGSLFHADLHTEDSPEESELIDWATIADAYKHAQAASSLAPTAEKPALDSVPNDQESNRARPVGCDDAHRTLSDGHPLLGAETGLALDQDNRIVTHEELRRASRAAAG